MKRIEEKAALAARSLPIQLLVRQFSQHRLLLLGWLLLLGLVSGLLGGSLGGAYLFLEPEYLGRESVWSLFIIGAGLGIFLFSYMITLFINEGYRYHFLALCESPFYTFAFNNLLLPVLFLGLYFARFLTYHAGLHGWLEALSRAASVAGGMIMVFLVSATYFFANRGFLHWYGRRLGDRLALSHTRFNRQVLLSKARESLRTPQDTQLYLHFPFQIQRLGPIGGSDLRSLVRNLSQHHGELLLLQVLIFLFIAALGILDRHPRFQIPAGASLLLILSLALLIGGAIDFWFRRSWLLGLGLAAGLILGYNQLGIFRESHQALGLDYSAPPVRYAVSSLDSIAQDRFAAEDYAHTIQMLENWKRRYQEKYGKAHKPRAVMLMSSGGGLRSAYWTFNVLQSLDSLTQGKIADEMRLMTGASGGMIGLAYYRELAWRRASGEKLLLHDSTFAENISQDLLNRIIFRKFTDILLPHGKVQVGSKTYDREAGYTFDDQLAANLPELAGRRLGDYALPEYEGLLPLMILSPTIINQGRQLYISAQPLSFLSRRNPITDRHFAKGYGVEFRRFFSRHQPDSLLFTTALRMNATFPVVLPAVRLPSEPAMKIMDAGAIDNYGTQTAVRYLFEFREWFEANTSGLLIIQVRDNFREDPIRHGDYALSDWLEPLGAGYYSMAESKDMSNDYLLAFLQEWYHGPVEVLAFEYPRETSLQPASLSLHLTRREKQNIRACLQTTGNQQAFALLRTLYPDAWLAEAPVSSR